MELKLEAEKGDQGPISTCGHCAGAEQIRAPPTWVSDANFDRNYPIGCEDQQATTE
jgi:hypothetical protein